MDNPVNSEIALDLQGCGRQDERRTGERNANRDRMLSPVEVFGPMPEHGVRSTRRQRSRCRDDFLPVAAEEPTGLPGSCSTVAWLVREPTGSPVGRLYGRGGFLANGGSPNSEFPGSS